MPPVHAEQILGADGQEHRDQRQPQAMGIVHQQTERQSRDEGTERKQPAATNQAVQNNIQHAGRCYDNQQLSGRAIKTQHRHTQQQIQQLQQGHGNTGIMPGR